MTERQTGWPRFRWQWAAGIVLLFGLGILIGPLLGGLWVGLVLAAALSVGWVIAYESWRGRNPDLGDPDDDGARL